MKNMRLRVNIFFFVPSDGDINNKVPKDKYSDTILSDEYIYLYGKWDENNRI